MFRKLLVIGLLAAFSVVFLPGTAHAQARDIDFDWIANTIDKLLSSYCPGITLQLRGADNDGNGIWDEDSLAQLACVLRGGTRVGATSISAANVAQIQANFATNRALVEADLMVYGEKTVVIFSRVARTYVMGSYGSDKLTNMLRAELGPVGGDLTAGLLLDYFAGMVTIGETATFAHINNYIGQIIDGLCAGMGNQDLGGVANMWNLLRAEKTTRSLYLTQATYNATRWGTGGSRPNLFGGTGNFDSTGTVTDTTTNIDEYNAAGPNRLTWRETFFAGNGIIQPPMRFTVPPVGTPSTNHVLNGDMTNGAGGAPTQWTVGANWAVNPQDNIAAVDAPTAQFLVYRHTAGNTAELTQTQAQQPATTKITTGVTYRVEFSYKWINADDATQTANGISVGLGTTVSGVYTSTNEDWHNETVYLTAAGANPSFRFIPTLNFAGYVDNVKVKVAALAGDSLDTGTIAFAGGVGPFTKVWENSKDFPTSNSNNQLNNNSFKGNANSWTVGTWSYVDKGAPLDLIPLERMEKTTGDTTELVQPSGNMKIALIPGESYTVSYCLYQTAGTLTPNLSGTNLTARSFVHSGDQGQVVTQVVVNGNGTQQLSFVPNAAFRGRIYYAYVGIYDGFALDPYNTGNPPGSRTPTFVADGVTGDPNDNGYRGLTTYDLQYTYLLPSHDGMMPWMRLSDTLDSPTYTSSLVYNTPDKFSAVPTGSIATEALGGRTTAAIKIDVGPRAFEISPQPAATQFAYTGVPFSMASGARGGDSVPRYQWYRGNPGDTSNPVGAAFSKVYNIASPAPANNGTYFMRATNLATSLDSSAVTVTVVDPVTITLDPLGANKAVGGSHTFVVTATGGAGALTYTLYKDVTAVTSNATGTFALGPLVAGDQGNYYVTATDAPTGTSTATSSTVLLTVLSTTNPTLQTVTSGQDNVTFSVTPSGGTGGYTYQWYVDGNIMANDAGHISGVTANTLRFDNVQVADGVYSGHPGAYTCVVRDSASTQVTSAGAVLTVNAGLMTATGPGNISANYAQTAVFSVIVGGGSGSGFTPTYTWYKGGDPTPLVNGAKYDLTTPGTLRVQNIDGSDNGATFYCMVGETPGVRPPENKVQSGFGTLTASLAPINFVTQPLSAKKYVGTAQTFTVAATGGVGTLTYQWQKYNGATWDNLTTGTSYTINPVALTDAGDYRCLVGDDARPSIGAYAVSNEVTLGVQDHLSVPDLPSPINRKVGDAYAFTVSPSGGFAPLTYVWKMNGTVVGGNAPTLDLGVLAYANQGTYTCTVSDTNGDVVTTNVATLTVLAIQTQPSGGNKTNGDSHTFSVVVTPGSGVPGYTYAWSKDGSPTGQTSSSFTLSPLAVGDAGTYTCAVQDTAGVVLTSAQAVLVVATNPIIIDTQPVNLTKYVSQSATFSIAAHGGVGTLSYKWQKYNGTTWDDVATGTSYTITPLLESHAGQYRCLVSDTMSQVATSNEAAMTVTLAAINVSNPTGAQKFVGNAHTFSVTASGGTGTRTFKWQKDGVDLVNAAGHIAGATTSSLALTAMVTGDAGTYVCLVGDNARPSLAPLVASGNAVLDVREPVTITVPPVGANKKVGDSHTFTVTAINGYGPYTYQWYRGLTLVGSSETLVFDSLISTNQGSYTCKVTGALGTAVTSSAAVLNVLAILTQPTPQSTTVGGSATFAITVKSSSGVPGYRYQWKYKGADIAGATKNTYKVSNCQGGSADGNPAPVNPTGNEGNYSCLITDAANVALESSLVPLTVNSNALNIIMGPLVGRAHTGDPLNFVATVSGGYGPAYTYQWQKDGIDLAGQTSATLAIAAAGSADVGSYVCLLGEANVRPPLPLVSSATATLEVADAVVITDHPVGAELYEGETFSASVAGTGGFGAHAYQWFKDGTAMPGETNATLTLANVTLADAVDYSATITDEEGSAATSNVAPLTVYPHVEITLQPTGGQMELYTPYTLNVTATGGKGALNYTWYKNGAQVNSGTSSHLIAEPGLQDVGDYWCVVSDSGSPVPDSATSDIAAMTIHAVFGFTLEPAPFRTYSGGTHLLEALTIFESGTLTFTWYGPAGVIVPPVETDPPNARTLENLTPAMAGSYYVTVLDDMGTVDPLDDKTITSTPVLVEVYDHLQITRGPIGGNFEPGAPLTLSVQTSGGFPTLAYEWKKDDVTVGTSPTLNLGPLDVSSEGSYSVTVTDMGTDSAVSGKAVVTVRATGVPVAGSFGLSIMALSIAVGVVRRLRAKK